MNFLFVIRTSLLAIFNRGVHHGTALSVLLLIFIGTASAVAFSQAVHILLVVSSLYQFSTDTDSCRYQSPFVVFVKNAKNNIFNYTFNSRRIICVFLTAHASTILKQLAMQLLAVDLFFILSQTFLCVTFYTYFISLWNVPCYRKTILR